MSRSARATGFTRHPIRPSDCPCPSCMQVAPFAPAVTREFTPYKPHPAGLLHICAAWDVHPSEVLMIGDSAKDDVRCPPPWLPLVSETSVPLQASAHAGLSVCSWASVRATYGRHMTPPPFWWRAGGCGQPRWQRNHPAGHHCALRGRVDACGRGAAALRGEPAARC